MTSDFRLPTSFNNIIGYILEILLLSAYDADSHQYWRKGLVANFPEHQWSVLTLPGRYFSWRIRGNSMSWAFGEQAALLHANYDLVIATSMTDLSSLRGFVPSLAQIPTILYFHENQFAYPATNNARANVEPQILNLYSALAADKLLFNSEFNYQSFMDGASALLKKLPDQIPANLIKRLKARASVLAVPLLNEKVKGEVKDKVGQNIDSNQATLWDKYQSIDIANRPLLIAWAARWEYDKGPDRLLAIVKELVAQKVDFRLCVMGQSFRQVPVEFEQLKQQFDTYIDQFGFADSSDQYQSWLKSSDVFLSTAVHEFQGLSVLEAVDQSCIPVLPNRLSYPELFAKRYLYESHTDMTKEAQSAVQHLCAIKEHTPSTAPTHALHWQSLKAQYQSIMQSTAQLE